MFKKLGLGIISASILIGGFFVQPQITYAENNTTPNISTAKEDTQKIGVFLNKISQGLYALTWPMMILAGTFVDNEVIYGTFIGLDKSLWGIWNMIRTFANFFIGFLFIVAVLAYFWEIKKDQLNPMKILPQMVVATVLVNSSWFLIGAMLDLSTIATYAVGLLPMKVDKTMENIAIPQVTITLAPTNSDSKFNVKLCGQYEACVFDKAGNVVNESGVCYALAQDKNDQMSYKIYQSNQNIEKPDEGYPLTDSGCIITKKEMLDNMKNLTGPFVSIFQSLMDSSQVAMSEASMSASTNISVTIMKSLFLIALIIPLMTLAIIMIVRAIILWMIIVFSPMIFLFTALTGFKGVLKDGRDLSSVITLIFLPVFVTFALSMSLVFMNALHKSKIEYNIEGPKLLSHFGCKDNEDNTLTCSIKEGTDIKLEYNQNEKAAGGLLKGLGKWIGRIIANLFGIGFMWVIVFAALKSSKVTRGIASSIQKFSTSMAKAAPLIPVAGAGMQSISSLGAAAQFAKQVPARKYGQQYENKIAPMMEEMMGDYAGTDKTNVGNAVTAAESVKVPDEFKEVDDKTKDELGADKPISELSSIQKSKISSQMGVDKSALEKALDEDKTGVTLNSINNIEEIVRKEQYKVELRKLLEDSFISKNIGLLQAVAQDAKMGIEFDRIYGECKFKDGISSITNIKDIFKEESRGEIVKLMKNFRDIGITEKENIFKLFSKDLLDNKIPEKEKSRLDDIYSPIEFESENENES